MKVFLDDVRQPYDDTWTVARDVQQFKTLITENTAEVISFDHDLGSDQGNDLPTGMDAANWLIIRAMDYPIDVAGLSQVIIHSSNPPGAENIAGLLENAKKHGLLPKKMKISKLPYERSMR